VGVLRDGLRKRSTRESGDITKEGKRRQGDKKKARCPKEGKEGNSTTEVEK